MSSVLRFVRRRRTTRRLGMVAVVVRNDHAGVEIDAEAELVRSLSPPGLMHVEKMPDGRRR